MQIEPDCVLAAEPGPDDEVDQRIAWRQVEAGDSDALRGGPACGMRGLSEITPPGRRFCAFPVAHLPSSAFLRAM